MSSAQNEDEYKVVLSECMGLSENERILRQIRCYLNTTKIIVAQSP